MTYIELLVRLNRINDYLTKNDDVITQDDLIFAQFEIQELINKITKKVKEKADV